MEETLFTSQHAGSRDAEQIQRVREIAKMLDAMHPVKDGSEREYTHWDRIVYSADTMVAKEEQNGPLDPDQKAMLREFGMLQAMLMQATVGYQWEQKHHVPMGERHFQAKDVVWLKELGDSYRQPLASMYAERHHSGKVKENSPIDEAVEKVIADNRYDKAFIDHWMDPFGDGQQHSNDELAAKRAEIYASGTREQRHGVFVVMAAIGNPIDEATGEIIGSKQTEAAAQVSTPPLVQQMRTGDRATVRPAKDIAQEIIDAARDPKNAGEGSKFKKMIDELEGAVASASPAEIDAKLDTVMAYLEEQGPNLAAGKSKDLKGNRIFGEKEYEELKADVAALKDSGGAPNPSIAPRTRAQLECEVAVASPVQEDVDASPQEKIAAMLKGFEASKSLKDCGQPQEVTDPGAPDAARGAGVQVKQR